MSITLNPPIVITAHKREGEGSSPVLGLLPARAENILYGDKTVKDALDELFAAFSDTSTGEGGALTRPPTTGGWQRFTASGDFIVPEDVSRVLVLCIGAGSSTASTRGGGVLVSRYLPVTPGETIPVQVGVPQSPGGTVYGKPEVIERLCSSFNGTVLKASWKGIYHVDGTEYTFSNTEPTIPDELKTKGVVTIGAVPNSASASTRGVGTAGTGGYAVPRTGILNERAAWLELARDMPPGTAPTGRTCYPDTSQLAGSPSGAKAGVGANYGGTGGCWGLGAGYSYNAAKGGDGLVCVFWGEDIDTPKAASDPRRTIMARVEKAGGATPLPLGYGAHLIPYVNTEADLAEGASVADALDVLYARLAEKEQNT